jgi:MFS transporter, Spinster family, sphingosine-1-phosphate transporter
MTSRRYAWLLVAMLWVVALLNYVDRQVLFSVFPLLKADLGLTSVQLGLLSTVFLWIYGLLSPVSGFLADRFGRSRMISVSLLVWSAVTVATGYAGSYAQLVAARGLMGISEACYLPAALAKIAEHHGPRTRSLAVGVHQTGLYIGMIVGGAGGGWLGQRYGWRVAFIALGAVGIAYTALLYRFLGQAAVTAPQDGAPPEDAASPATAPHPGFAASLGELARLPGFAVMTIVFSAMAIANWLVYTWLPLYLYERYHMSLAEAGFTATFYIQSASFAGILLGGWFADRWSAKVSRGRLYTQVCGLLLASPFLFLLGHTYSYAVLVMALVLFGVGRGFYDCNTMPVLCQVARNDLRSTGYGIFNFAGCIAGGVIAALAGALKHVVGLAAMFQIAAAILCLSGLLLLRIRSVTAQSH